VRLKAVFDNRDHALFPAQFVNVQMLADTQRSQLIVPAAALQEGPQGTFVYVVRQGKAGVRPVTIGLTQGERASVTTGVDVGELVVTDGIDRLRDGASVDVRQ
jgi:multidrug efflux system membrane fusion protein